MGSGAVFGSVSAQAEAEGFLRQEEFTDRNVCHQRLHHFDVDAEDPDGFFHLAQVHQSHGRLVERRDLLHRPADGLPQRLLLAPEAAGVGVVDGLNGPATQRAAGQDRFHISHPVVDGPVVLAGQTLAVEPITALQTLLAVRQMLVRENWPVVLGHHLAAFDATGRCDHHRRSQEVPERNKPNENKFGRKLKGQVDD